MSLNYPDPAHWDDPDWTEAQIEHEYQAEMNRRYEEEMRPYWDRLEDLHWAEQYAEIFPEDAARLVLMGEHYR